MIFDINKCKIYIGRDADASDGGIGLVWNDIEQIIGWTKYSIKESDMRVKTASFTTPSYIDLTTGAYAVRIVSIYHENFSGRILSAEYDEDTGLYTYQCQDWSREYVSRFELSLNGKQTIYHILQWLLTRGQIGTIRKTFTKQQKDNWKNVLSGLDKKGMYDQSLYHNITNLKPMDNKPMMLIRDKSFMETIRALTIGTIRFIDLWFNDNGVLQITPLDREDWMNTGLILEAGDIQNRKFKFDTTNVITDVIVNGEGFTGGKAYSGTTLTNLNLSAFFGIINTSVKGSTNSMGTTSAGKSTTNATNNTTTTSSTTNPYNNKAKNIIVSADRGSNAEGFKNGIIKKLKADGWNVTDLGVGAGTHSESYRILSKKYAVNLTIYNGVDPKTVDEPVTGWLKGKHEKYGVQLVQMWDTDEWTSETGQYNKKGMKYYKHGDFSGYRVPKAWDDNYSGVSGGVKIENLQDWYIKHYPKAIHCCGATVSEAYNQFISGGYLKMKGLVGNGTSKTNTTKTTTTSSKKTTNNSVVTRNDVLINKANARQKVIEHSRDYFSCKITLPLGNTALKNVHTNQFLFTRLPEEFELANWTLIASTLSGEENRYTGADYNINRWYVEGNNITVEAGGNAKMELSLNAFASNTGSYASDYKNMVKAYTDAVEKENKNTGTSSSASKNTTNATTKNSSLKGGQGKTIDNLVKKICSGINDDLKKAKAIHEWLRENVIYKRYCCAKYKTAEDCYKHRKSLNCADTATLTCRMMLSAGLKAYIVHRTHSNGHFWTVIEIGGKRYVSDQTGRESASMKGSAWNTVWYASGDRRTGNSNGGNWDRKNGDFPDCYPSYSC